MSLLNLSPAEFCAETNACEEGRKWALTQPTMADVWDNCPRVDWLLWIVDKIGKRPDDRTLRLFAVWCARNTPLSDGRKTGDLLTDPRSLAALEVAERFADGQATNDELYAAKAAAQAAAEAARDAAEDATWAAAQAAAEAARDAAEDATCAAAQAAAEAARDAAEDAAPYAARAAAWAAAWDAARDAAEDATWAAAGDAARDAAEDATWAAAGDAQSAHLRTLVPNPFRREAQP